MESALAGSAVEDLIAAGDVRSVYQPIVELASGRTIGFEALARGPEGSPFEMPAQLFPAAARAGRSVELERACLHAAFTGAAESGLNNGSALFVNLEPGLLEPAEVDRLAGLTERARDRLSIVIELTERELLKNPTELFAAVDRMRSLGLSIALDDIGADTRSLALIPFLKPEVMKLDLKLIQDRPRADAAAIVHAVNAEAERTGALVLAEGIETPAHLQRASAIGATLGQGWYFGRPEPLGPDVAASSAGLPYRGQFAAEHVSPYEIVADERDIRTGDKRLLLALSRELEEYALDRSDATVLLASFQRTEFFTPAVARRYERMADHLALIGTMGQGPDPHTAAGVRWAQLDPQDRLGSEWNVVVIGPHFAAAFVATDLGDECEDMDRRFEFALTYDRELAVLAGRAMMRRFPAHDPEAGSPPAA